MWCLGCGILWFIPCNFLKLKNVLIHFATVFTCWYTYCFIWGFRRRCTIVLSKRFIFIGVVTFISKIKIHVDEEKVKYEYWDSFLHWLLAKGNFSTCWFIWAILGRMLIPNSFVSFDVSIENKLTKSILRKLIHFRLPRFVNCNDIDLPIPNDSFWKFLQRALSYQRFIKLRCTWMVSLEKRFIPKCFQLFLIKKVSYFYFFDSFVIQMTMRFVYMLTHSTLFRQPCHVVTQAEDVILQEGCWLKDVKSTVGSGFEMKSQKYLFNVYSVI